VVRSTWKRATEVTPTIPDNQIPYFNQSNRLLFQINIGRPLWVGIAIL
jgi:hypothetical protein